MTTTSTTEPPRRAVAIFGSPTAPQVVAELLTDFAGLTAPDALIQSRYAPGVLPMRIEPDQADLLVEKLSAIGLAAAAIDPNDLLDFHSVRVVHHARLQDAGLELVDLNGQVERVIPWDNVTVISAGQVPLESEKVYDWNDEHLFATARRSHHEPHRGRLPPVMELWLIERDDLRPLRIDQTRMNYETLGDSKTDSAAENFRLFLTRLVKRTPQAYLTPASRAYLERQSLFQYTFSSSAELQHVTQLHALLAQRF